jgi:hypothetical protein
METAIIVGVVFAAVGAVLGVLADEAWRRLKDHVLVRRPLRRLLDFDHGLDIVVVYPPRIPGAEPRILPEIALEDFMAIWNVVRLLTEVGRWETRRIHICDHAYYLQNANKYAELNRIIICSPRSNKVAEHTLPRIADDNIKFVRVQPPPDERWEIQFWGAHIPSPSYDQADSAPIGPIEDVALVAKVKNPESPTSEAKILVLAGIRGIGTWGAADFLRKRWREDVYRDCAGDDFAFIVSVKYQNFNISSHDSKRRPFCKVW